MGSCGIEYSVCLRPLIEYRIEKLIIFSFVDRTSPVNADDTSTGANSFPFHVFTRGLLKQ
jgi:hypothetical protein